jgi:hypothetical protein
MGRMMRVQARRRCRSAACTRALRTCGSGCCGQRRLLPAPARLRLCAPRLPRSSCFVRIVAARAPGSTNNACYGGTTITTAWRPRRQRARLKGTCLKLRTQSARVQTLEALLERATDTASPPEALLPAIDLGSRLAACSRQWLQEHCGAGGVWCSLWARTASVDEAALWRLAGRQHLAGVVADDGGCAPPWQPGNAHACVLILDRHRCHQVRCWLWRRVLQQPAVQALHHHATTLKRAALRKYLCANVHHAGTI